MVLPVGSRFRPKDLGLVRRYLHNMVERKESGFITIMDVYKDEPWLLPHVRNPLFDKKEWYYFVPLTKRAGGNITKRTVPGRGESEGGFWKSTGKKTAIKDGQEKLMGFKQCLTYYRKRGLEKVKTDWLMKEYTLDKGHDFQDLVLCYIQKKKKTNDENLGLVVPQPQAQVPQTRETNNIVPDQLVQEADFAHELEAMILQGEDGEDTQQQEEETQILPPLQINNNYNVWMPCLAQPEVMMRQGKDYNVTQQQRQQEEEIPTLPPLQSNDKNKNNGVKMSYQEQVELDLDILDFDIDELLEDKEQNEWDLVFDELVGEGEQLLGITDQDNMFTDSNYV